MNRSSDHRQSLGQTLVNHFPSLSVSVDNRRLAVLYTNDTAVTNVIMVGSAKDRNVTDLQICDGYLIQVVLEILQKCAVGSARIGPRVRRGKTQR